jgi:hypothetical protein
MALSHRRFAIAAAAPAALAIAAALLPPFAQDPRYHAFADARTLCGMPNFSNVISNLPFLAVALCGLRALRSRTAFVEQWERVAYCALLAGTAAVAAGSTYYHLHPDNSRLFCDRLPLAVVFMSLLASTVGERVSAHAGKRLLVPLILFGAASVLYWHYSGDLRPYCLVQFGSLLAVPFLIARFPPRYSGSGRLWLVLAFYALAKVAELLDRDIASLITTGGHPRKHLAAAAAILVYVNTVAHRAALGNHAAPCAKKDIPSAHSTSVRPPSCPALPATITSPRTPPSPPCSPN